MVVEGRRRWLNGRIEGREDAEKVLEG